MQDILKVCDKAKIRLEYWIHLLLDPLENVSKTLMGAQGVYNIPGRTQANYLLHNGSINPAINVANHKPNSFA